MCEELPAAQAAEWGLVNWAVPRAELDAKVDEVVEKLAAKLPETTRYAKQQLNWWRDVSWHETVGHARDWLAMSMLGRRGAGRGAPLPRPLTVVSSGRVPGTVPTDMPLQDGFVAFTIAPWRPSATSCVKETSTCSKPAAASPASYSPRERAPAMHPA